MLQQCLELVRSELLRTVGRVNPMLPFTSRRETNCQCHPPQSSPPRSAYLEDHPRPGDTGWVRKIGLLRARWQRHRSRSRDESARSSGGTRHCAAEDVDEPIGTHLAPLFVRGRPGVPMRKYLRVTPVSLPGSDWTKYRGPVAASRCAAHAAPVSDGKRARVMQVDQHALGLLEQLVRWEGQIASQHADSVRNVRPGGHGNA
eukprot:3918804-Pleurochrysis_carterae.AAC.1